ncbi:MAG: hypothetical protein ACYS8X_06400 [Planctomycetota bacterium]|jgi:hypothetical protein
MFSIDQNCHSLWDTLPKLQALGRRGLSVRHFIEDVDVAFTAVGATQDSAMRFERERYYGSGGADWGAAVFYSDFLGRLPVDVRSWETYTGLKIAALARQLSATVDDLYDRYSPSDNWQLIGPSYAGDRQHHRLIGDLAVSELADHLHEMLRLGERDMLARFPAAESQQRIAVWLADERARLDDLISEHADGALVDLYGHWLGGYLDGEPNVELDVTSALLAVDGDPAGDALLNLFISHYARTAELYNQAMAESNTGLHPLDTKRGELPFFASTIYHGRQVRMEVVLAGDAVQIGDEHFPLDAGRLPVDALKAAGVTCLTGKAALLILQARACGGGTPLVVPYRGSPYMPAVHALHRRLEADGLLVRPIGPLMRIKFSLLDRMSAVDTPIALPDHLAAAFGRAELPASEFAAEWRNVAGEAGNRLRQFESPAGRHQWQRHAMAATFDAIAAINTRRRQLAQTDPKSAEIRDLSHRVRQLEHDISRRTLDQIALDYQVANVDFWDSRGALYPWCVALGDEAFYEHVLDSAELYEEPHQEN